VVETGTWKKIGKNGTSVMYTPGSRESRIADTGGSYSSNTDSTTTSSSKAAAASWVFFSPQKKRPLSSFHDHSSSSTASPTIQNRDPYADSRLMRKNLLSTFPVERQAELMESLTRLYTTAHAPPSEAASPSPQELSTRATKTRLLLLTLFTVFEEEFSFGMPLPRSSNTSSIGLAQALKDSCREKLAINGSAVTYSQPASEVPEVAAKELTDILGSSITAVIPGVAKHRKDLGRLTGRILGALCRTGSGGDTYCAVTALFDIAGSVGKAQQAQAGEKDDDDVADVFPFLILPGKVSENDLGPVRVTVRTTDDGRPVAEIITESLLDVHLADEAMVPPSEGSNKERGGGGGGGGGKGGMSAPAVRLKATIVEVVSLEIGCGDRERMLRLEGIDL
jgi:hypothetical protein